MADIVEKILQGNIGKGCLPDPPSRTIKLFVSSTKFDFETERNIINDVTLNGELSSLCSKLGLDLVVIDQQLSATSCSDQGHHGNAATTTANLDTLECADFVDPHLFEMYKKEISQCQQQSLSTFFVCLIGNKYKPLTLPVHIGSELFRQVLLATSELSDNTLLATWYEEDQNGTGNGNSGHCFSLRRQSLSSRAPSANGRPSFGHFEPLDQVYRTLGSDIEQLVRLVQYGVLTVEKEGLELDDSETKNSSDLKPLSAVHSQLNEAIRLDCSKGTSSNGRIVAFVRRIEDVDKGKPHATSYFDTTPSCLSPAAAGGPAGPGSSPFSGPESSFGSRQLIEDLICGVDKSNIHFFNIPWSNEPKGRETSGHPNDQRPSLCSSPLTARRPSSCLLASLAPLGASNFELSEVYKEQFRETFVTVTRAAIERHFDQSVDTFAYPADVVCDAHAHLVNARSRLTLGVSQSRDTDFQPLMQIKRLISNQLADNARSPGARHGPLVVVGGHGTGKTTLLSQVFAHSGQWLTSGNGGQPEVYRIIRHLGQSPASSYATELLRTLCQHICLLYGFESNQTTLELGSLSIWFQELLKMVEVSGSESYLVILLDDLDNLKTVQMSAILGWLPWSLPTNVQLVCSVSSSSSQVLDLLKSRIPADNFVALNGLTSPGSVVAMISSKLRDQKRSLTPSQWSFVRERLESDLFTSCQQVSLLYVDLLVAAILSKWTSSFVPSSCLRLPVDLCDIVDLLLEEAESKYGQHIMNRICAYLCHIRYGLREVELLELMSSETTPGPDNGSTKWLTIKDILRPLLREYYVLGRRYFTWSNKVIGDIVQSRVLDQSTFCSRTVHSELASAFFAGFTEVLDKMAAEEPGARSATLNSSDLVREMDELWYHLTFSGDLLALKKRSLFNIDFLMSSVKCMSISYLRSILELVKGHFVDYELELLFTMTKHSISVLSAEPEQLSCEIIMWLTAFGTLSTVPVDMLSPAVVNTAHRKQEETSLEQSSDSKFEPMDRKELASRTLSVDRLLVDTRQYCDRVDHTFLVPGNSWLTMPIPLQMAAITCPWDKITRAVLAHDRQHIIAAHDHVVKMFHLPSRSLVACCEGHERKITCLNISENGSNLATGSEDSSLNIWTIEKSGKEEIKFKLKHRLSHHVTRILCLTFAKDESLVISGSEQGALLVVAVKSGQVVKRLDQHRSMVTCVKVNNGDDIFVTGSSDCTIIVWSLDSFCPLNIIHLTRPIYHMDISSDSTFLMVATDDNVIHVRALTTGSEVHCLDRLPGNSVVSYLKFAEDSCRAIAGTGDGKVHIYDVHSGKLTQTLAAHGDMITAILTMPDDRFLVTAGGNKVVLWNFSSKKSDPVIVKETVAANKENVAQNSKKGSEPNTGYQQFSRPPSKRCKKIELHRDPITAIAVSRDGTLAVTGSRDWLVKTWSLPSGETHTTLEGHTGSVTSVAFAPNGNFCVSGSDDTTVRVWGLTLGLIVSAYREHLTKVVSIAVSNDSRKILSVDSTGVHRLWVADSGVNLVVTQKTGTMTGLHGSNVFFISGKADNTVKIWSIYDPETERSVTHSEQITCYTVTHDGQTVITGSQDCSLKVWEVATGKITQVLVGHEAPIMAAGTAALSPTLVISGSQDCNAILWDMTTGSEMLTLSGHTATVIQVKLTIDGTLAITGGEDNVLLVWSRTGQRLVMLDVHHAFTNMASSLSLDHIVLQLATNCIAPIFKLHNNPARGKTLELPVTPGTGPDDLKVFPARRALLAGHGPKKSGLFGRALKREQSFDSFYFDHLNRGVSVDDFRKLGTLGSLSGTPTGSREHLATTGIIWDGGPGERPSAGSSGPPGRGPRMKVGPKQKMLKKQQSMFAFFPEHGVLTSAGSVSNLVRPQCPFTMGGGPLRLDSSLVAEKKRSLAEKKMPSRTQSLDGEEGDLPGGPVGPKNMSLTEDPSDQKKFDVTDSSLCTVM